MRGAFVACFGDIEHPALERVADAHRWHSGAPAEDGVEGFRVAVRSDPSTGPHVFRSNGALVVVHGDRDASFDDLRARGERFAVVESDGRRLRAARDPLGLAPLFYRVAGGALWLSTEIAPLVALGGAEPDLEALAKQAALMPDPARTGFLGIRRLLPGHELHGDRALAVSEAAYWSPGSFFGRFAGNQGDAAEELWARLLAAVDRATLDGSAGILVSGGMDSAAVAAAARQLRREVALVHVAFAGVADAVDEPFARDVAAAAGLPLDVVPGEARPWNPEDDLELGLVPYLTPPAYTADTALVRLAALGASAALDGNDGDGLFGVGGREWGALLLSGSAGRLLELAREHGAGGVGRGVVHDLVPPGVFDTLRRRAGRRPTYLELTLPYFDRSLHRSIREVDHERWRPAPGEWRWRQLRQVLPVTTVRMEEHELRAARHGLDARHPFADRRLVEFAISLPVAVKSDPIRSKAVLRAAIEGHAPRSVVDRLEKPGYLSIFDRRVDRGRCLEWIEDSGVRLPLVDYDALLGRSRNTAAPPLFLLVMLARAHVFAARAGLAGRGSGATAR